MQITIESKTPNVFTPTSEPVLRGGAFVTTTDREAKLTFDRNGQTKWAASFDILVVPPDGKPTQDVTVTGVIYRGNDAIAGPSTAAQETTAELRNNRRTTVNLAFQCDDGGDCTTSSRIFLETRPDSVREYRGADTDHVEPLAVWKHADGSAHLVASAKGMSSANKDTVLLFRGSNWNVLGNFPPPEYTFNVLGVYSAAAATGDLNFTGDTEDELVLSEPNADGKVYIIEWAGLVASGEKTINLNESMVTSTRPWLHVITGDPNPAPSSGDMMGGHQMSRFGSALAVGYLNEDSFADLVIGAYLHIDRANNNKEIGAVYVLYGSSTLPPGEVNVVTDATLFRTILGDESSHIGARVAVLSSRTATNSSGGGDARLVTSDPAYGTKRDGIVYVINPSMLTAGVPVRMKDTNRSTVTGSQDSSFGSTLLVANLDPDSTEPQLFVGAPGTTDAVQNPGNVYALDWQHATTSGVINDPQSPHFTLQFAAPSNGNFGLSLAAQPVTATSPGYLVIGNPSAGLPGQGKGNFTGAVYVYSSANIGKLSGSPTRTPGSGTEPALQPTITVYGAVDGDRFGGQVAIGPLNTGAPEFPILVSGCLKTTIQVSYGVNFVSQ